MQNPHPPIFVAVSRSEPSVRYCARNGFTVVHFSKGDGVAKYAKVYQEEAAKHGLTFKFGERQNTVRWPHIAKSPEDLEKVLRRIEKNCDHVTCCFGIRSRPSTKRRKIST